MSVVCQAIKHLQLLFCMLLHHALIQNRYHDNRVENTNYEHSTSPKVTTKTETTCGPAYSMARMIGTTAWQQRFHNQCHLIFALLTVPVLKSLITWTDLFNGYSNAWGLHMLRKIVTVP